jgi:endonuclease/exonuclease/phosphatase family metal-dependent hydrolase
MKSANSGHENTYPARKPCRELDYILYSPDLPLKSFRVIPFPGSDHLPLLAEFDLSACSALKNA